MLLPFIVIIPLLGAIISATVRKNTYPLQVIISVTACLELIIAIIATANVLINKSYFFDPFFSVDAFSAIILLVTATVSFAASFYSIGYLKEEVKKDIIGFHRVKEYFVLLHLFLGSMFLAIITVSPIVMWVAVEATTLSTAFLISFYSKLSSMEAAWKYLIVNSIGLLLGFLGTIVFLSPVLNLTEDKFVNWFTLNTHVSLLSPDLTKIAFIFILIGYGTKAGLAPMHTWLPDAHSKAPPPISALLSGALLNIAMMAILRFKIVTDAAVGNYFSQNLLIFFGVISIAIPAFIIIVQKNYKRLFAYSSIEHMGIMAIGFGFGGIGTFGALLHMIYHSLTKSVLFFSAGNIFLKYSSTRIANVKGVLSSMPTTGIVLLIGFLAIIGMPPFGIFITEFYILSSGITKFPLVVGLILILLILIFVGFLKHIVDIAFSQKEESMNKDEANIFTIFPAIFLLVLFIFTSLYLPQPLKSLIDTAVTLLNK
ncbi:MAG: proton-conducting transporter membrane subunit [Candidatus Daviesbacteria bacterium]|nr:proton-conducting transporter membrane subunit [Candidatus Daviesbacteria bacterium]